MTILNMIKHLKQSNFIVRECDTSLTAMSYINQAIVISLGLGLISAVAFSAFATDTQSMSFVLAKINEFHQDVLSEKLSVLSVDVISETSVITITNYGTKESSILAILSDEGNELSCTTNNAEISDFTIPANHLMEINCINQNSTQYYIITQTKQIMVALP